MIADIGDPDLRARVCEAVSICQAGLQGVDKLKLDRYELVEAQSGLWLWEEVAAPVRQLLVTVGKGAARLKVLFPVEAQGERHSGDLLLDLDQAFAEAEQGGEVGGFKDKRESEIDHILEGVKTAEIEVARAIDVLASMLQHDFLRFGQRLRLPEVTAQHWVLLGEHTR